MKVERSGSPGYLVGDPLLLGTKTVDNSSSKSAILFTPNPLYRLTLVQDVATGGQMTCAAVADLESRLPVTFGEDVTTSCSLHYSYDELSGTNCAVVRSKVYQLQTLTAASLTHVGMFGNAALTNVADWIAILNSPPPLLTGTVVCRAPV